MVSWLDPAAMSLIKTKRLKTIEHDGKETTTDSVQGYERWLLHDTAKVTAEVWHFMVLRGADWGIRGSANLIALT